MRKSASVILVLSGSLLAGCNSKPPRDEWGDDDQSYTNNTYVASRGYYHAPYHAWYPFPYNHYAPGRGYFHGGAYTPSPNPSTINQSRPLANKSAAPASSSVRRGGFSSFHSGSSGS